MDEAFGAPLMDNSMRGFWCEYMVAEALGSGCRTVGLGWNLWDLQFGNRGESFPHRIRIQVKNSARTQTWNRERGILSATSFNLDWRRKPAYFERDFPDVECEDQGFMCDAFVLCHHGEHDFAKADHREPAQWDFYILPVAGPNCAVTSTEFSYLREKISNGSTRATTVRRPGTLSLGIRGRPAVHPLKISQLSCKLLRRAIGV